MQAYKKRGFWIGLAAFFFVLFLPNPESLSSVGWAVAAVTLLMAIWWATEAVPVAVTATGTASVAHQIAINNVTAATAHPTDERDSGFGVSRVKKKATIPSQKPLFL